MNGQLTYESELFNVLSSMTKRIESIKPTNVVTPKEAMLSLRVDWEELNTCLHNRKLDGFEPAVDCMIQLAATSLAMAAELQAKLKNEKQRQLTYQIDEEPPPITFIPIKPVQVPVRPVRVKKSSKSRKK